MAGGRQHANPPQTFEQMVASNELTKPKKKARRDVIEANKNEISMLVGDLADRLEENEYRKDRVNLKDTERVKAIVFTYIRSCQFTGTLPTITGIALAVGCYPDTIARFIRQHPDNETSRFLKNMKIQFGELLGQAALAGDVAPIPAIFTLKATYNWNDQPIQETADNSEAEDMSPDAIAAKYEDIPD